MDDRAAVPMSDAVIHAAANATNSANAKLMQRTAWAAVAVASVLIAAKLAAYLYTDSIAMLASLADSTLDVIASSVNLIAIRHALMPPDAEHRFGHGKAEPLAGLAQGAFIAGSVVFLAIESISRLLEPHAIQHSNVGIAVMVFSIIVTAALVILQRVVVKRTGSIAIGADQMHYMGDLLTNVGVIIGIIASAQFGILVADPIIGLGVAGILSVSAWHVFHQSYDQLMDRELPDAERDNIKAIVMTHEAVRDMHDLRTRSAGLSTFIQMHIELDPAISLMRAHEVSDAVEADLFAAYPNAEIIIHQDPAGVEDPPPLAQS